MIQNVYFPICYAMLAFLSFLQTNHTCYTYTYFVFNYSRIITVFQMNFDGLDDQLDIGYTPTFSAGSRSAGMKKIGKKPQNKPPANTNLSVNVNAKKQSDIDLLDELLSSPAKTNTKKTLVQPSKPANISIMKNHNDADSFFDDSPAIPSKNMKKDNNTSIMQRPVTAAPAKPTPNIVQDAILDETESKNVSSFKFKRPQTAVATTKPKMDEEPDIVITPSTRMMKPPLRKRDSMQKKHQDIMPKQSLDGELKLPQESNKFHQIAKEEDNSLRITPGLNRRSSIQGSGLQLNLNNEDSNANANRNKNRMQLLDENPSKPDNNFGNFSTFTNKIQTGKNFQDSPKGNKRLQIIPETKKVEQKKPLWQNQSSNFNQIQNQNIYSKPIETNKSQLNHQQLQKQIQFVKRNYQKHIDALQKNLDEQIKNNKQTRQRLMKQAQGMIENQRARMKKIHEEQLQRVKQMGEWEKKKVQQSYKGQVQTLKHQVQRYSQFAQNPTNKNSQSSYNDRKQIQYLQERLRSQRKLLQQKSKLLDKRQLDLEQREKQFNKRKRLEEQKLRNQQKRIFQAEIDAKKVIMNQKRLLEDQKQSIATELATLQMGNYKRLQNIQNMKTEIELQKKQIEKQKNQIRNFNNTAMLDFHKKNEELKHQKNKINRLQSQLVGKLKIVQTQASKLKVNSTISHPNKMTRQNDWVVNPSLTYNSKTNEIMKRPMSVQRESQQKKLQTTQNRFMELTSNLKQNIRVNKRGEGFDLDNYLMSMAHYTRAREQVH